MFVMRLLAGSITLSVVLAACGSGDGSSVESGATTSAGPSTDSTVPMTSADGSGVTTSGGADASSEDDSVSSSAADDTASDGDPGESSSGMPAADTGEDTSIEPPEGALVYEPFDAPDGVPWQAPWTALGGLVDHEITNGQGRLQGEAATVGRMLFPDVDALDVDATATVVFEDWSHQGFGLYVRQNGGYLVHTDPYGQGYALYVEGGFMQNLGVWRERDGVEEILGGETVPGNALESGTPYRVRFRCTQQGSETRLQAKIWPASEAEPGDWIVDIVDDTPVLQDASGALAVDIYNYQGTASILVDDITLMPAD